VIGCTVDEEILAAYVLHRGHSHQLHCSPSELLLLDYLGRHRHCMQSAPQIAAGIQGSEFYRSDRMKSSVGKRAQHVSRSCVRVHIARLRQALARASIELGFRVEPTGVIVSQPTLTNVVLYRLRAEVEWIHHLEFVEHLLRCGLPSDESKPRKIGH
jgi:hypothetical protein